MKSAFLRLLSLLIGAGAFAGSGCTDPVRDDAIDALGPETQGGPGPDHRPGQPCLLCHSDGGPASDKPFAVAGTLYESDAAGAKGASDYVIQFVDATGGSPVLPPPTGESGNFYVPLADWTQIAFPIRAAVYKTVDDKPLVVMKSLIGRNGSCNYCHQPTPSKDDIPSDKDAKKKYLLQTTASAGQMYVNKQGSQ